MRYRQAEGKHAQRPAVEAGSWRNPGAGRSVVNGL